MFCAYYSVSPWDESQKALAYLQIAAMAFPLLSSIAVGMLYETEAKAGNFHAILSVPGYPRICGEKSGNTIISLQKGSIYGICV